MYYPYTDALTRARWAEESWDGWDAIYLLVYVFGYVHVSLSLSIYIYIYRERERYIIIYIYIHTYIYIYIYIYIYTCFYSRVFRAPGGPRTAGTAGTAAGPTMAQ